MNDDRIRRCTSCQGFIIFLPTATGNKMPIDAETVDPEDSEFNQTKHMSHFATCPRADSHRKPRRLP